MCPKAYVTHSKCVRKRMLLTVNVSESVCYSQYMCPKAYVTHSKCVRKRMLLTVNVSESVCYAQAVAGNLLESACIQMRSNAYATICKCVRIRGNKGNTGHSKQHVTHFKCLLMLSVLTSPISRAVTSSSTPSCHWSEVIALYFLEKFIHNYHRYYY